MCRASKRRLASQFEDLQRHYLQLRSRASSARPQSRHTASLASSLPTAKRKRISREPAGPPTLPAHADHPSHSPAGQQLALQHSGRGHRAVGAIDTRLQEFASMLSDFTRCSKLKVRPSGHSCVVLTAASSQARSCRIMHCVR